MYKLLDFLTLLLNIRTTRNTQGARPGPLRWLKKLWPVVRLSFLLFMGCFAVLILTSFLTEAYFKKRNTTRRLDTLSRIIVHYRQNHAMFPPTLQEVVVNDPQKRDLTQDSWGNPIHYLLNHQRQSFTLTSAGKDQQLHTADDLTEHVSVGSILQRNQPVLRVIPLKTG